MYELKSDASVRSVYPKDDKGNVLHQTLEQSAYGSGTRLVLGWNENLQRTEEIVLLSDVDWMIPTLHTPPWPIRYIPNKVYKHVDINSDVGLPQQVNNKTSFVLFHAEVFDVSPDGLAR